MNKVLLKMELVEKRILKVRESGYSTSYFSNAIYEDITNILEKVRNY